MAGTLAQKIAKLPENRRKGVEKRAAELIEEEMSLQQLRKALDLTQVEIASRLGVGQDTVSRYEHRADMLLSTLQGFVRAMGGELKLTAEFPDRHPITISKLEEIEDPDR